MPVKDEPVVIKKYANRRLYNTGTSTYVTLEDLADMVKKGEDFTVQDARSGDDITHPVLTQIIFELENKEGQNMLPVSFLRQLISYYGDHGSDVLTEASDSRGDAMLTQVTREWQSATSPARRHCLPCSAAVPRTRFAGPPP